MKKILVILTGGTIGSKVSSNDIDVDSTAAYSLLELYKEKYEKETEFKVICPYQVLSENMDLEYWMKLYDTLNKVSFKEYEGIIITHGSDTLAYTSNFLGYLYDLVTIPIILIASNYPLTDERSNGLLNFKTSVDFIRDKKGVGVFTIFSNRSGEIPVYCATNIKESDPYLDQFSPFDGTYYDIKLDEEWLSNLYQNAGNEIFDNDFGRNLPPWSMKQKVKSKIGVNNDYINNIEKTNKDIVYNKEKDVCFLKNHLNLRERILGIRIYPGMDFSVYDLTNVKAVLCYLYHSATANVEGKNTSILTFIHKCKEKEIPIYVASFKEKETKGYVTKNEILKAGAIPLCDISYESAYMKLLIGMNQDKIGLHQWMIEK